ncbi:isochorismatase [Oligella sp. HMSC05A10]|nr:MULTISPECIES: isochorismatase family cysteine hydrolase [Oligella]OFS87013.1 isochorismatase [Oligella sp. HMSC05A10]SUA69001.1 Isochorismatase family protein yecD [Oligella urethralis]
MKKAFILIDYSYDFIADQGALTTGQPGQALEQDILSYCQEFVDNGDYLVIAMDDHFEGDQYHPESKLFPPHNLHASPGQQLYGAIQDYYEQVKTRNNVHFYYKTRYSAFAGTNLDQKLRERDIKDIYLAGVCTDICIIHTAVDAYNLGYTIHVPESCVASFNQAGHEWALNHFESALGAKVIRK